MIADGYHPASTTQWCLKVIAAWFVPLAPVHVPPLGQSVRRRREGWVHQCASVPVGIAPAPPLLGGHGPEHRWDRCRCSVTVSARPVAPVRPGFVELAWSRSGNLGGRRTAGGHRRAHPEGPAVAPAARHAEDQVVSASSGAEQWCRTSGGRRYRCSAQRPDGPQVAISTAMRSDLQSHLLPPLTSLTRDLA